ncbi:MAG: hypothetical protein EXR64_01250 [Dehalococcoidia bacterium]|nr:hypothetical protein [Dehalococcoidia bacterium]
MVVAQPRQPSSRLVAALLAALAAAALMPSTLALVVDPGLLGRRPDHGHVFRDGGELAVAVPAHRHPGDAPAARDAGAAEASTDVVFTAADAGVAGALALATPAPLAIAGAPSIVVDAALPTRPPGIVAAVPAPPPRA